MLPPRKPMYGAQGASAAGQWLICMAVSLALLGACAGSSAPPAPTSQPVTLRFTAAASYEEVYPKLIEQFHKEHPNVTVEWVQVGGPGAASQLTCATCDVVRVGSQDLSGEQLSEYLPLDDIIAATKGFKREEMAPGIMEALRYGGVQMAVPAGINPIVAYYNRDLLKARQVDAPTADWTLDDLAKTARALSVAGGTGSQDAVYGFCSVPQSSDPAILAYLFGGQLVDDLNDPTRPTLNTKANVEAVQWYADLRRIYRATPDPEEIGRVFGNIDRAIWSGRCGIWLGFYLDYSRYTSFLSGSGRAVPGMLPLPRGRTPFGVVALDGYAIPKASQHVDAAWQWIQFLLAHPEAAGTLLPAQPAQYRLKSFAPQAGQEGIAVARSLPSTLFVWGNNLEDPLLGGVAQAYLDAVEQVVQGQTDAETALNNAQARAEAVFKGSR